MGRKPPEYRTAALGGGDVGSLLSPSRLYLLHPFLFIPPPSFSLFLTLLPTLARSFISPPYYRMLVLALVHLLALALLLLPIEFCSSSFMHPIRPIARTSTAPPPPPFPPSHHPRDCPFPSATPTRPTSFGHLMRHRGPTTHSRLQAYSDSFFSCRRVAT